jgi:hypothetical protein
MRIEEHLEEAEEHHKNLMEAKMSASAAYEEAK